MKNIQLPYLDDFLLYLQTNNYSEETIYNYERDLSVFENFLREINTEFEKINKKTILNYKAYLTSRDRKTPKKEKGQKRLSSFSINRMLSSLRSYLKFLIDMDYNPPIPPDTIKLIKTPRKHPRVAEFEKIIELIESPTRFEKK
jgi:integrase/recombinase XerC